MRKKIIALVTSLILISTALFAKNSLSGYDITFYKTVSESLSIANKEKFGFDYTGFGFIGDKSKDGIFLRLGLQTPLLSFTTLVRPLEITEEIEEEDGIISEKTIQERISDITLTVVLGNAKRYIFDKRLDFYLGYGFNIKGRFYSNSILTDKMKVESSEFTISFDVDAGVKFLLKKNHSLRIGVYGTYSIFGYTSTSVIFEDEKINRIYESVLSFLFVENENNLKPIKFTGYISMGTTFTNKQFSKRYKYTISEDGTKRYIEE